MEVALVGPSYQPGQPVGFIGGGALVWFRLGVLGLEPLKKGSDPRRGLGGAVVQAESAAAVPALGPFGRSDNGSGGCSLSPVTTCAGHGGTWERL